MHPGRSVGYSQALKQEDLLYDDSCTSIYRNQTTILESFKLAYCPAELDGVNVCWPPTPAGELASVACPERFHIFKFRGTDSCMRMCHRNGTWHARADYSNCSVIPSSFSILEDPYMLCYICGYVVSSITVIFGIAIFQHFASLKCVRNGIHTNFMLSLLIRAIIWFTSATITSYQVPMFVEGIMATLRAFILGAVYSWMLVEGLHLMNILFFTMVSHRIHLPVYCAIGWGIPAVMALSWALTKVVKEEPEDEWQNPSLKDPEGKTVQYSILGMLAINLCITLITVYTLLRKVHCRSSSFRNMSTQHDRNRINLREIRPQNKLVNQTSTDQPANELQTACLSKLPSSSTKFGMSNRHSLPSSMNKDVPKLTSPGRTTLSGPYLTIKTKAASLDDELRLMSSRSAFNTLDSVTNESECFVPLNGRFHEAKLTPTSSQRNTNESSFITSSALFEPWKAVKAILFLMPLLGYPQLLFLRPYQSDYEYIFNYINAFLISTQGFWVSVIYCFLNSEVQRMLKLKWRQWRTGYTLSSKLNSGVQRNSNRIKRRIAMDTNSSQIPALHRVSESTTKVQGT